MDTIKLSIPPYPVYKTSAFRELIENEWHITRSNAEYILLIMFEGELNFTENGVETALHAGDWYIQKPGIFQSADRASKSPKYYYIHFDWTDITPLHSYFPSVQITLPVYGKCNPRIYSDLLDKLSGIHPDTAGGVISLQGAFLEFLTFFIENETEEQGNKIVLKLSAYMREHYKEDITLKDLSSLVNYSEDYLRSIFKSYYNLSPKQFLTRIRMENAKKLLSNTDYSIESVAVNSGYQDPSVFYRNFCKAYNMSPSEWRKLSRNLS